MKIACNVEVNDRTRNVRVLGRSQKSILSLGKKSMNDADLLLLLQSLKNKLGTKYKVKDNIEQIFAKFLNEGKATIRLKEPPHDLIIQGDQIQLKGFLNALKYGIDSKFDPKTVRTLSVVEPKKLNFKSKKLHIDDPSKYPHLAGFPRTIEELSIIGLDRRSFDERILQLQSLTVLNFSNNCIESLPRELGRMPSLRVLNLSGNKLTLKKLDDPNWLWMTEKSVRRNLRELDLSSNEIQFLTYHVGKLKELVMLNVANNKLLIDLPESIGKLRNLKVLQVGNNFLNYLPGSMRNLRLDSLSVVNNPLTPKNSPFNQFSSFSEPSSLVELAARTVLNKNIFYDFDEVPLMLRNLLDRAFFCPCGRACLEKFQIAYVPVNVNRLTKQFAESSNSPNLLYRCFYCSPKCLKTLSLARNL